ncbi:MAG TPA: hypothetical protein ENI80_11080 [Acidiferrobacteraceae bacterium]|nr:hypothetical protein [Acidiferrobacteraceae bacterium]
MSSTLPPPDIGAAMGGLDPAKAAQSVVSPAPNSESAKGFSAALEGYQAEAPPPKEVETGPSMASDGKALPPPVPGVEVQGVVPSLGLDIRMLLAQQTQVISLGSPSGSTMLNPASLVDGSGAVAAGPWQSLAGQAARPAPSFLNGAALSSTVAAGSGAEEAPNAPAQPVTQRLLAALFPTEGAPVLPSISSEPALPNLLTPATVTLAPVGINMPTEAGSTTPMPMIAQPPAIATPLNQAGWDQALGNRVMWLVNNGAQTAQLQLNPPELGPLDIRISINHDQASIVFNSQYGAVREALDAALPRLRDFLHEQGLTLVQADVTDHGLARQDEGAGRQRYGDGTLEGSGADDEALWMADLGGQAPRMGVGLLDIYV